MAELPYMPMYWEDFFSDPRVIAMPGTTRGIYALLLGAMWNNGGYLPDNDKVIARMIGIDKRMWQTHRKHISHAIRLQNDAAFGRVLLQDRLVEEYQKSIERIEQAKARTAAARAKLAAKTRRERAVTEAEKSAVTEPAEASVSEPATEPDTGLIAHNPKDQAASAQAAGRPDPADLAGLGVRHLEEEASAPDEPVTEPQIAPMVELPAPSPSLLNSKLVNGAKPLPASDGGKPRSGLMAALDRAAQKRNGAEN
jgi:uncharacterized protein YdaU (DUF1376 family)